MIPEPDSACQVQIVRSWANWALVLSLRPDLFTNCRAHFQLGRFAFAAGVSTRTIDVRRFLHSLTLGAAVLTRRRCA
jgi:hypothetical protein